MNAVVAGVPARSGPTSGSDREAEARMARATAGGASSHRATSHARADVCAMFVQPSALGDAEGGGLSLQVQPAVSPYIGWWLRFLSAAVGGGGDLDRDRVVHTEEDVAVIRDMRRARDA